MRLVLLLLLLQGHQPVGEYLELGGDVQGAAHALSQLPRLRLPPAAAAVAVAGGGGRGAGCWRLPSSRPMGPTVCASGHATASQTTGDWPSLLDRGGRARCAGAAAAAAAVGGVTTVAAIALALATTTLLLLLLLVGEV
jgi:hypothetical protein